MTAREILRWLVRRFGLLLLLTLVGGGAGATYAELKTPTYTAKAYVVAIGDPGDAISALNFAQAYGRIATSGPVLAQARSKLTDTAGLTDVTASTSPDAPVIEVTASATTGRHAADLANAVAGAVADYGSSRKASTRVGLSMLAGATVPPSPSSPKPPLELTVGAAAGLLIGGLAVLAGVGRSSASREQAAREQATREQATREQATREQAAREQAAREQPALPAGSSAGDARDQAVPEPSAGEPAASAGAGMAAAEADEPPTPPTEIERYRGVARTKNPQKAIASYRAATAALPAAERPQVSGAPMIERLPDRPRIAAIAAVTPIVRPPEKTQVITRPAGQTASADRPAGRTQPITGPAEQTARVEHPRSGAPPGEAGTGHRVVGRAAVAGAEDA